MPAIHISDTYYVSPQITVDEVSELAAQGFTKIICNRPNIEVPANLSADAIGKAAKAAGIEFSVLELTHQTMTPENIKKQSELVNDAYGKVLAYCASGTRCTIIWALGQAIAGKPTAEIIKTAASAGYNLSGLEPTLHNMAIQI